MDFLREQITVSFLPCSLLSRGACNGTRQELTILCDRHSRSLLLVSTTGTSACAERKRPKARPPNPAIEVVDSEKWKRHTNTFSLLRPISPTSLKEKEKVVQGCSRSLKSCKATRELSTHRFSSISSPGVQGIRSNWRVLAEQAHNQSPRPNLGVRRAFCVSCPPLMKINSPVHIYILRKREKLCLVHNNLKMGLRSNDKALMHGICMK